MPVAVSLDGGAFDERTSSLDWFYERLRSGAVATAAEPTTAELAVAYDRAASRGARTVVSIHLDSRLSGTVASAEVAARGARLPVTVVDTGTVNFGVALCVRAAAEAARRGGLAADAVLAATRLGARMETAYVARGGPAEGWMLSRFVRGAASRIAECASEAEAVERMAHLALRDETLISVAVGHAGRESENAAHRLARRLGRANRVVAVERYRVGPQVGARTGSDSFGAFWWPV